jgi:hypothetical protein
MLVPFLSSKFASHSVSLRILLSPKPQDLQVEGRRLGILVWGDFSDLHTLIFSYP